MITIYTEGKADKKFIEDLCKHIKPNKGIRVKASEGISDLLRYSAQNIKQDAEKSSVAVIVDANNDITDRKKELNKLQKESGVKFPYFLLPNNKDKGNLETLLLAVCKDPRPSECFTQYKKCIKDKKLPHSPDKKAEIYAYCQTIAGAEEAKETERNYTDKKNLES